MAVRNTRISSLLRDRLESVQENFDILQRQIKDGKATPNIATPPLGCEFYAGIAVAADAVSKECTKLALMFSKPPPPSAEECGLLSRQLEQATLRLVTILYQLNSVSLGETLMLEVKSNVLRILKTASALIKSIIKDGYSSRHGQLRGTGSVWGSCEATRNISKSNKMAAAKELMSVLHILQDAKKESDELESRQGEEEDGSNEAGDSEEEDDLSNMVDRVTLGEKCWSEADRVAVQPCLRLVELCVLQVKEVCSEMVCGGINDTDLQDSLVRNVKSLSSRVDDLVSELPAPVSHTVIKLARDLGDSVICVMDVMVSGCRGDGSAKSTTLVYLGEVRSILQKLPKDFS